MSEKMIAPELFRPQLDFLDVPYDAIPKTASGKILWRELKERDKNSSSQTD